MAGKRRIDPVGLEALLDQGLGCARIAPIFNVSKRAVNAAAHRWRLPVQGRHPRVPGGHADRVETAHQRALAATPKVDPAELARLVASGLRIAELERALNVHRATLHRVAKRTGLALPKPRYLAREDWVVLIVEHGLDVPALALATGRMRCVVRRALLGHGLLQTWWGKRGKRFCEWTLGKDDE